MSSNPFEAPPRETATPLPPNRAAPQSPRRTLVAWIVIIVLFVALYHVADTPSPSEPTHDGPAPAFPPLGVFAGLLPALVYGAMIVALFTLRARLPASHRTGELRTEAAPAPAAPAPDASPPPIDLHLVGTDGSRPIRIVVDAEGLHWHADARLLKVATELHVRWSELESVSSSRVASGLSVLAWVAAIFTVSSLFSANLLVASISAAVAVVLFFVSRKSTIGVFAFATPTHALTFQSRQLDAATCERLVAAVRARKPSAAPAPAAKQASTLRVLFVDPFVQLFDALRSDAHLDAKLARDGAPVDAALHAISRVQTRMFSVWSGTMRGAGPVSIAIAAALAKGDPWSAFVGFVPAWILGLLVVQTTLVRFARFAGLTVLK